jgi:hypothetical protein
MKNCNFDKSLHVFCEKVAYKRTRKLKCLYEEFIEKVDEKDILLCDAQSLFYDFLEALQNVTIPQWRESLLNKKCILIDGFHYFEQKKSALEELTYIFKHTNAAIFLTLNKPLAECDFGEEMQYILSTGTQKEIGDESCDYMSSRETQEYWKKTGYTPSAAEATWLIKQDRSLTFEEKHKAWKEILATIPDCAFDSHGTYDEANIDSVHNFLSEYMALENRLLERFHKKESNAVYTYKVWCDEDGDWLGGDGPLYVDFNEALAEFQNYADLCPKLALFTKVYFGAEHQRIYIYMRPDGAVTKVAADLIDLEEKEYKIFYEIFYGMNLVFESKSEDEK